ncbi:hypothetical protein ANSO36C_16060 [Nostoc cf. commune SO-36]|uniref:Calcium-binding protein n=1 Tax=Nostoc cf. commune SO-36 TaxID=449208 RepID=A0ABN6PZB1_NOSCO|nr:calcium-binding protein [Nostoc commune]BDI15804.1 hypothetical protein ANSO36C_16060 [Nostoc cf. commune SO-36]
MADFNIEFAEKNLGIIKSVFDTLKTPLGNEKSDKIIKAIDNANSKLTVGLRNDKIEEILKELDFGVDGVAGNNISADFSSFKFGEQLKTFGEQLKTQINGKLPSVSANLNLNWSLNSDQGSATLANLKLGSLLGQNSFIGGVLSNVELALNPVRKIIDGLTEDIPFITKDIPNGLGISKSTLDLDRDNSVSVIDLLNYANNNVPKQFKETYKITGLEELTKLITEAQKISTFTEKVKKASNGDIPLPGSLKFDTKEKKFLSDTPSQGSLLPKDLQDTLSGISNFTLPVLQTQTAAKLFFGQPDVSLFEYEMPKVSLITSPGFAEFVKIPIVVPALKVTFGPTIGGSIALGFGYDSTGFYIKDVNGTGKPELEFKGEFRVGVELGAEGIAEIQGGGNIGLTAGFSIPQDKARTFNFTTSGSAYAYLDASASIDALGAATAYLDFQLQATGAATDYFRKITKDAGILGDGFKVLDKGVKKLTSFFKKNKPKAPSAILFNVESPRVTLWEFGGSNKSGSGEPTQPILAALSGDVLFLNIGTRSGERKVGNITDGSETFKVTQTDTQLLVSAFGLEQAYPISDQNKIKIIADGGLGNDIITIDTSISANLKGGKGNDKLYGSSINDILYGEAGDDELEGGDGIDQLYGGTDNDTLSGGAGNDKLFGEGGNDILYGEAGNDELEGGDGIDKLYGGIDNDRLYGGAGNDKLFGEDGRDLLLGDAGDDELVGGADADTLYGGSDTDTLYGGADDDKLLGEAGNDFIDGATEIDTVSYDNSPSSVVVNIDEAQNYQNPGGTFHTTIVTTSLIPTDTEPNFTIAAGTAKDGFGTTDTLRNLENIIGSAFDDVLIGNSLNNRISGLVGNDLLVGNAGNDSLDGGDGIDTVSYRRDPSQVIVNLEQNYAKDGFGGTDLIYGEAGDDWLDGGTGSDRLYGGDGNDELYGQADEDLLKGEAGNDNLNGGDGNDQLYGQDGRDTLNGDAGNDYLEGGTGDDLLDGGNGNDQALWSRRR